MVFYEWYATTIAERSFVCFIIFQTLILASCEDSDNLPNEALITSTEGHIVGNVVPEAAIFYGVPFSLPPVGEWRWKSPREPTPYVDGYWNATYTRDGCVQNCNMLISKFICAPTVSEDCLYLNIWVPHRLLEISNKTDILERKHYIVEEKYTNSNYKSLAVMFYLHGGNFRLGAGSAILYDGRYLASKGDVIVITTNYRLNALGFLAQDDNGKDVNFGILDQIQALNWVKRNIAAFGGNPNKITIVGQSAGAESVGILMTSRYGKGLFQRAVMQSNPWSIPYRTLPEAKALGDELAKAVGCQPRNMTCLRLIHANEILKAGDKVGALGLTTDGDILIAFQMWGPIIDGDMIPRLPLYSFTKVFRQGLYHRMPVVLGHDLDEGYLFIAQAFTHPLGELTYAVILEFIAQKLGSTILQKYPPCGFCDSRRQLSKIATDYAFFCPSRRVLFAMGNDTWGYVFNGILPWKGLYKNNICTREVCHGNELPYLFDSIMLTNLTFNDAEQSLSSSMQIYWANFIKHGNPNGKEDNVEPAMESWPRFRKNKESKSYDVLELQTTGNIPLRNPVNSICSYWDALKAYGKY